MECSVCSGKEHLNILFIGTPLQGATIGVHILFGEVPNWGITGPVQIESLLEQLVGVIP